MAELQSPADSVLSDELKEMTLDSASCSHSENSPDSDVGSSNGASAASSIGVDSTNNGDVSSSSAVHQDLVLAEQAGATTLEAKGGDLTSNGDTQDAGGKGHTNVGLPDMHPQWAPAARKRTYGIANTSKDNFYYAMNSRIRGHCLIFNHMYFEPNLGMNTRNGTNKDRDEIQILFSQLGFKVSVFNDLVYDKLKQKIEEFSLDTDHTPYDCIVIFFLSHGEEGVFYSKDAPFKHDVLFKAFEGDACPSLAGKPKLFFIQACRGGKLDHSVRMMDQVDAPPFSHKLPVTADIMTMWSTVPGYYSWRNTTNGSWFIQSLISVLKSHARHMDLQSMHSVINRHMIFKFESNTPGDPGMHGKKQVSSFVSTATRLAHFYPPPSSSIA